MVIQHRFIIHFIDMISRKNQNKIWIIIFDVGKVLIDCMSSSSEPFFFCGAGIGLKDGNTTGAAVHVPWCTNTNMGIKDQRLVLCQYTNCIHVGVGTVGKNEIDDSVFSTERYCWFCDIFGEFAKPRTLPPCKNHCKNFCFHHLAPFILLGFMIRTDNGGMVTSREKSLPFIISSFV